jgi:hypothetical protein
VAAVADERSSARHLIPPSKRGRVGISLRSRTKFDLSADARETIMVDPDPMKTTRAAPVAAPIVVEELTKRF